MSMGVRHRNNQIEFTQDHGRIRTLQDDDTIRINSRDYVQTSGSSIGFQSKPNQTVTTTGDVIGAEFSPRVDENIGAGTIIALKADPVVKTGTGNLSNVRGVEINIDFDDTGARTVSGDVCAVRVFPDLPANITYTGDKSVFIFATPNAGTWDYLFDFEATAGLLDETNGTYSTADGFIKIKTPEGDARLPYFLAVD